MIRRPPRSTLSSSSAASDVYKRQRVPGVAGPAWLPRRLRGQPARSRPGAGKSPMNPNADRANRALLTLLALLLLVGAGFGLTLRFGVFGTARANQPLLQQVGTDRVRELDLERNTGAGATTVSTSAVTDAVTTEMAGYRGVERTSARLIGDQDRTSCSRSPSTTAPTSTPYAGASRNTRSAAPARRWGSRNFRVQLHVQLAAGSTGALTGVQVKAPARTA